MKSTARGCPTLLVRISACPGPVRGCVSWPCRSCCFWASRVWRLDCRGPTRRSPGRRKRRSGDADRARRRVPGRDDLHADLRRLPWHGRRGRWCRPAPRRRSDHARVRQGADRQRPGRDAGGARAGSAGEGRARVRQDADRRAGRLGRCCCRWGPVRPALRLVSRAGRRRRRDRTEAGRLRSPRGFRADADRRGPGSNARRTRQGRGSRRRRRLPAQRGAVRG